MVLLRRCENFGNMIHLIIATRNAHKAQEIQAILGSAFNCVSLQNFLNVPAVAESADTFAGNASLKAAQIAVWLHGNTACTAPSESGEAFVLADDSGLEVDALAGAPGVHSARFAALDSQREGNSSDAANNGKLLRLLANTPAEKRTARFRCVLALVPLAVPQPPPDFFEGTCEGRIATAASGHGGFGYDPLFIPAGFTISFAELGDEIKNQMSHRARALAKLRECFAARVSKISR